MTPALKRKALAGLFFAVLLGPRVCAHAQGGGEQTTPTAQSAERNDQAEVDENDAYLHSPTVIALGRMLGMGPELSATVFGLFNFALLAAGIGFVSAKKLPKILRGRSEAIQKDLADARTATEEARGRLSAVEERLSRLDGEIAALQARSEQDSAHDEARIKASVEEEKKKIVAAAEQEIAAATMHAQKRLQEHAAELAIEQAARRLVVSAETDRLIVQNFAQRLTADDAKKGQN